MRIEHAATAIFVLAVLHTFLVSQFQKLAHKYPEGSKAENLFHLLGETEAVFILWAGVLWLVHICISALHHVNGHPYSLANVTGGFGHGWHEAIHYIESLNYTEAKFVFVIMVIAGTKPVIDLADAIIRAGARLIPLPSSAAFLLSALFIGAQLGSFITEPAAMTVTAILLVRQYFSRGYSRIFKYMLFGTLLVLVSIGGVHTPFAAPPVLMVADKWDWDIVYMERHFGWKAAVAILTSSVLMVVVFFRQLCAMPLLTDDELHASGSVEMKKAPWWVIGVHLGTLALVVVTAHHSDVFMGVFVFFLGFCVVTHEYQEELKVKQGLLVGGFLAGLVTLGGLQSWWLEPLLASLNELQLYLGATALTAITDNAALTFLGSQVEGLSDGKKYALVAGAVSGGGLTVIANAPNPAGYSIVNPVFGKNGISPLGLFLGALPATIITMICFWYLPSL
ncbi:putative Na+/H+ antiporter [Candidatus Peribacteria bacterium]|nr:MAG: putative Na+/H+ antiporter [Candidatus Peribacteria bacterium]